MMGTMRRLSRRVTPAAAADKPNTVGTLRNAFAAITPVWMGL